jgi:hypothetical protein
MEHYEVSSRNEIITQAFVKDLRCPLSTSQWWCKHPELELKKIPYYYTKDDCTALDPLLFAVSAGYISSRRVM